MADLSRLAIGRMPGGGRLIRTVRILGGNEPIEARVLLDSGSDLNLIQQRLVVALGLQRKDVKVPAAHTIAGQAMYIYGAYDVTTDVPDDEGQGCQNTGEFYSGDFGPYDLVLGMPWLEDTDPMLSFRRKTLHWARDPMDRVECLSAAAFTRSLGKTDQLCALLPLGRARPVAFATDVRQVSDVSAAEPPEVAKFYSSYQDVFSEELSNELAPHTEYDHSIDLEEGKAPPHLPIYNMSQTELQLLREYLDDSTKRGWIRESRSPAGAPILFVPKKNGKMRLCVDYRGLNKVTIKNRYPLPLISELLDRMSRARIFTKLDLRWAYHRIRIKPGDEWKTAFRTRYGHFEYLVMPFGLANAPATFQGYINKALGGLVDTICVVYLDDILIFSRTGGEHVKHVETVLERLRIASLYVNLEKCEFHTKSVDFLGFVVTPAGVVMDPERVKTIAEWPAPLSYRDIQVFLGFANFYRRFVSHYSEKAVPLNQLLAGYQKDPKKLFEWPDAAATSFRRLAEAFTTAPLLQHFDPAHPILVITDASDFALAGILLQPRQIPDGARSAPEPEWEVPGDSVLAQHVQLAVRQHWLPVAFHSKKFTAVEGRYDTHDKELMAIFVCFKHWRHYLEGASHEVKVLTDHDNLRYFMTTKTLTARQGRWAEYLSAFDFRIEHLKGTKNPADGLSRRPDYERDSLKREGIGLMLPTLQHKLRAFNADIAPSLAKMGVSMTPEDIDHPSLTVDAVEGFDAAPDSERSREIVGELTGRGRSLLLAPRRVVAAVAASETAWEDTPTLLLNFIKAVQDADPDVAQKLAGAQEAGPRWQRDEDGLIRRDGKVWIPDCQALKQEIMSRNHDDPAGGHCGRTRTHEVLKRKYWWLSMYTDIRDYVHDCAVCNGNKSKRHLPHGELVPLKPAMSPHKEYTMDFVTDLPPSLTPWGSIADAILVLIDRFAKLVRYIPCNKDIDAVGLAEVIFRDLILKVGVPEVLISDRGSVFTSKYWSTVCWHLRVNKRLSTAFHPQTDGQTERQNQEMEAFLRCYCSWDQSNWASLLPQAEFAYNSKWHSTIKMTPLEAAFGVVPNMPDGIRDDSSLRGDEYRRLPDAVARVARLRSDRVQILARLNEAQEIQAKHYNRKHKAVLFEPGSDVLLSAKNIKVTRPSKKLSAKYLGPFKVIEVVGRNAYRLDLPQSMRRLHPVFHVSLLEPYRRRPDDEPAAVREGDIEGDDEEWEIEEILDHQRKRGKDMYLVKWLGWSTAYNQWLDEGELGHAERLLTEFKDKEPAPKRGLRRSQRLRAGADH